MLSHALNLDDWPLLARHRFLDAWRVLKAEGAAPAPAVAAPAPAAAAPAPKKQKESQARHAFAVGERVEAHWEEKWWPAVVHGLEDDGSYEVHWDGYGQYDYVAADAVRAVPWSAWGSLGRIFGK